MNVVLTIGLHVPDESDAAGLFRQASDMRQPEDINLDELADILDNRHVHGDVHEVEITD